MLLPILSLSPMIRRRPVVTFVLVDAQHVSLFGTGVSTHENEPVARESAVRLDVVTKICRGGYERVAAGRN